MVLGLLAGVTVPLILKATGLDKKDRERYSGYPT
tara:strand:- start:103 stop:204 length:102 start_codon:yes stop_codon:yes gene_type:complete